MHHAVGAEILHEGFAAGHLGRNIDAWNAPVQEFVLGGILQHRLRRRLHMQHFARHQIAIGEMPAVGRDDRAAIRRHLLGGDACALRRLRDQKPPHLRRGMHDRGAGILHGVAAGGVAFVGGARGVRRHDRQPGKIGIQLLGGDLQQRRLDALPELGLAGEHGDGAIGIDANPGIEKRRLLETARKWRRRSGLRRRSRRSGIVLRESRRRES